MDRCRSPTRIMVCSMRMEAPSERAVEMVARVQLGTQPAVIRTLALDLGPEAARVVHVPQVRELVADHVVDEVRRRLDQPPGEPYFAPGVAGAPPRQRRRDQ